MPGTTKRVGGKATAVNASTEGTVPELGLAIGDRVVYASHGIGRITGRVAAAPGAPTDTVVVEFDGGLKVTLPIAQARESLRALSGVAELEEVQRTLSGDSALFTGPWTKRFRAIQEKVTAGDVTSLAEVVRDGVQRDRRVALKGGSVASPSERHLYLKARKLLAEEIGLVRGIDAADADAWIVEQVGESAADA
jgi:CarD family transcriptional regulator